MPLQSASVSQRGRDECYSLLLFFVWCLFLLINFKEAFASLHKIFFRLPFCSFSEHMLCRGVGHRRCTLLITIHCSLLQGHIITCPSKQQVLTIQLNFLQDKQKQEATGKLNVD